MHLTNLTLEKWHNIVRTRDASALRCVFHCGNLQLAVDFTEKVLQNINSSKGTNLDCWTGKLGAGRLGQ